MLIKEINSKDHIIYIKDLEDNLNHYKKEMLLVGFKEKDLANVTNENWPDYMPENLEDEQNDIFNKYVSLRDFHEEFKEYTSDHAIHSDHFADHIKNLFRDSSDIKDIMRWPYNHIDWDAAEEELDLDYNTICFNNSDYYIRK